MNNRLYSHIYLNLKNTYTLKISSTLAKLLMEKPSSCFEAKPGKNMRKAPGKERNFKKRT